MNVIQQHKRRNEDDKKRVKVILVGEWGPLPLPTTSSFSTTPPRFLGKPRPELIVSINSTTPMVCSNQYDFTSSCSSSTSTSTSSSTPPVAIGQTELRPNTSTGRVIPSGVLVSCATMIVVFLIFLKYVFRQHEAEFAGKKRLRRSNRLCKSSSQLDPPDIRSWDTFHEQQNQINDIQHQSMMRTFSSTARTRIRNRNEATSTSTISSSASVTLPILSSTYSPPPHLQELEGSHEEQQQQGRRQQAQENDMDHIYLNVFQFLWAFTFVGPFSYFLWKKATMILKLRVFLVEKWGWTSIKKSVSSLEEVVGKLVLEQSQVIYYVGQRREEDEGITRKIASFLFPDFPIIDINGKFKVANSLAIDIDLDKKKMTKCTLDGETLNASEALILFWFNTISAQHVKVHSYGNWGVNPETDMRDVNPYYERSSIVSIIYNYFGFTSFPSFMYSWRDEGLLSKDWDPTALTATFEHGVRENICEHSNVTELMPYSDMVAFVTKTRWNFHKEFRKYRHMFPGVNAEGLFAATVLHSLDHELMEWNLVDPLWLDVKDPRFGKMAELGRVVRVGFVPQVPGYYFNRFFKGSGHPFFEAVYAKASKVNKEMADCLETCICR